MLDKSEKANRSHLTQHSRYIPRLYPRTGTESLSEKCSVRNTRQWREPKNPVILQMLGFVTYYTLYQGVLYLKNAARLYGIRANKYV